MGKNIQNGLALCQILHKFMVRPLIVKNSGFLTFCHIGKIHGAIHGHFYRLGWHVAQGYKARVI